METPQVTSCRLVTKSRWFFFAHPNLPGLQNKGPKEVREVKVSWMKNYEFELF